MDTKYFTKALAEYIDHNPDGFEYPQRIGVADLTLFRLGQILNRAQELKEIDNHGN